MWRNLVKATIAVSMGIILAASAFQPASQGEPVPIRSSSASGAASSDPSPAPSWAAITAPEVSASSSPTVPTVTTPVPSIPLQLVASSVDIEGEIYAQEFPDEDGAITPDTAWSIVWWSGGGAPGASDVSGNLTTYLFGHSGDAPAVFNRVKDLAPGDIVELQTNTGTFRYEFEEQFTVEKPTLDADSRMQRNREGRLVLISCWRGPEHVPGTPTEENVVVVAQLVSYEPVAHG